MKLYEMMIALGISVLLLEIVSSSYLTEQAFYQHMEAVMQMQENMRIASTQLSWVMHHAGYRGCGPAAIQKLRGGEHEFTTIAASAQHATVEYVSVDRRHLLIKTPIQFHTGETLLISDCQKSEFFKVEEVDAIGAREERLNLAAPLQNNMVKNAEIYRLMTSEYFVECHHQHCGLYVLENNIRKLEWIPNIKAMSVRYSTDAPQLWVSIRLTLMAEDGQEKVFYIDAAMRG